MSKNYLDSNGLLYFWQKIKNTFALATDLANKVDKVSGKGLSTNDYTTAEQTKLSGIATGAQVNVLEGIQRNGTDVAISNKKANISVPTKTSDLTNDSGFITSDDVPEGSAASSTTPKMDGTAAVGSETAFARGDHVHPSDTSRVPTTRTVNGHALSANVTVTNLDLGQGYGTCSTAAGTQEKVVTLSGYVLTVGGIVSVLFSNAPQMVYTLNINGKGAKPVRVGNDVATSTVPLTLSNAYVAGVIHTFRYDGTNYVYLGGSHDYQYENASSSTAGLMSAADKTKVDKLVFDSNNLIDSSILPSFVDDVIEAYARSGQTELSSTWLATGSASGTVITPETGKIYVLMSDSGDYSANSQFRWGGSAYVKLNDGGVSAITNSEIDTIVAS